MKVHLSVYSGEVLKAVDELRDKVFPKPYSINTLYKGAKNRYLYENSKGYLHIVRIQRQTATDKDGKPYIRGYIINDKYVDKDGKIKERDGLYWLYPTEESARDAMLEIWPIGNTCEKCECFSCDQSVGQTECNSTTATEEQTQEHYTDNRPGCPCFV